MRTGPLIAHGGHIKPAYAPDPGNTTNWAGKSTSEDRPDGQMSGIRKRYRKDEPAASGAIALGFIKAAHASAIEYTGISPEIRGLLLFSGVMTAACGIGFGGFVMLPDLLLEDLSRVFVMIMVGLALCLILFGLYMLFMCARLELFRPQDEPIIFDRKNRKVYRIFRETHPGLKGLFRPWPMRAAEYYWDLIDVEYNTTLVATGSTVMTYHTLIFIVRRSETDPTIIDSFNLGNTMQMSEQTVPAVWEHVRRFMEEDGPHLPPGEVVAVDEVPQTLWQSLGAIGPVGPNYRIWWRELAGFMVIIHVLFPFFVPFFLLWGIFNWASYKTATPVHWPPEVLAAIGMPTAPAGIK